MRKLSCVVCKCRRGRRGRPAGIVIMHVTREKYTARRWIYDGERRRLQETARRNAKTRTRNTSEGDERDGEATRKEGALFSAPRRLCQRYYTADSPGRFSLSGALATETNRSWKRSLKIWIGGTILPSSLHLQVRQGRKRQTPCYNPQLARVHLVDLPRTRANALNRVTRSMDRWIDAYVCENAQAKCSLFKFLEYIYIYIGKGRC